MAASEYPLTIEAGTTFSLSLTYAVGATADTATPVSLPGCTGKLVISRQQGQATPDLVLTDGNGTFATPTQGVFGAIISSTQTAALKFKNGYYYYDVVSNDATPVVQRLLKGKVEIDRG